MNRYITPLIIVTVALSVYVLFINQMYKDIQQQLVKVQELEAHLADAKTAREKLDQIALSYQAFPIDADQKLNVLLPDRIDSVKLIVDVESVASRHGLVLTSPSVTGGVVNPNSTDNYVKHSISFKVSSTYPLFREFIADVEKSLALRDFSGVSFISTVTAENQSTSIVRPEFVVFDYQVELMSYSLR